MKILLGLHVVTGSIALLLGPVPMLSRKGGRVHRKAGFIFSGAMACSAAAAFVLALVVHSNLLLTIAVLTGFLIFCGVRAPRFRRGASPHLIDDLACLLLAGFGFWLLWRGAAPFDVTSIVFGVGSLILSARQWQQLRSVRPDWLLAHIAGMGGAYTATVTAFLVVNIGFLPKPVIFIAPTLIGTALIAWTSVRHASRTHL
ncbi:MAG TPA: hypothetical protein PLI12_08445 [Acetobacteraceae bacterium]|nr:hypothetical protein [Acetobacteraceae bacterium]